MTIILCIIRISFRNIVKGDKIHRPENEGATIYINLTNSDKILDFQGGQQFPREGKLPPLSPPERNPGIAFLLRTNKFADILCIYFQLCITMSPCAAVTVNDLNLSCKSSGRVAMQACITLGTEPFDQINGTYTTLELYFLRTCESKLYSLKNIIITLMVQLSMMYTYIYLIPRVSAQCGEI